MKYILFVLALFSQIIQAQNLQSFFSFASFNSVKSPFLETYLAFDANSLILVNENNKYFGEVDVQLKISKNNVIVFTDHYLLKSPAFDSISHNNLFFIDQQRIPLKKGDYTVEIIVSDMGAEFSKIHSEDFTIDYEKVAVSDIQLIDHYSITETENKLSKSGYNLSPFISNFYPKTIDELTYYFEVYNTAILSEGKYVLHTYIESFETNVPLFDFNKMLRKSSSSIESNLLKFNIEKLPTGNYNLVCEIKDVNNEAVAFKKLFFQRSNSFTATTNQFDLAAISLKGTFVANMHDKDSLKLFIDYLYPICTPQENTFAQNQLKYDDLELMQKFFFNFWESRNALDPKLAWGSYLQKVKSVNNTFNYFRIDGYLTDRGRVYLQYGPPNSRHKEIYSADNVPYEIWHYYKLANQSNKKFVFVDVSRVSEYKLSYSNVDGEVSNLEWMQKIEQNANQNSEFRNNYINPR